MKTLSADGAYQVSVTKVASPLPLRANVVIIQAAHVVFKQLQSHAGIDLCISIAKVCYILE